MRLLTPRYNANALASDANYWTRTGPTACINVTKMSERSYRALRKIVDVYFDSTPTEQRFGSFNVVRSWPQVLTLQRCIVMRRFNWLMANLSKWDCFAWRHRRDKELPVYILFKNRLLIWNGTHRTVICYLLKRKCLARYVNLDRFVKQHPEHKKLYQKFLKVYRANG